MAVSETDFLTKAEKSDRGTDTLGTSITWDSLTHEGSWRSRNDDSLCVEVEANGEKNSRYLMAVADGLGGFRRGDIASKTAIKTISEEFHRWNRGSADHFITRAIRTANQQVYDAAHMNPELANMQTTMTAVAVEQDMLVIGHVGDCRLYRVRGGQVELLTRDHSFAADLLRLHLISPEQVRQHPERNRLTRTVGSSPLLHVDVVRQGILPEDVFILCSDGLWSEVSEDAMKNAVQGSDPTRACEELIEQVLNGEAPDNITLIIFRIDRVRKHRFPFWPSLLRR